MDYIGLGPTACSKIGNIRYANTNDFDYKKNFKNYLRMKWKMSYNAIFKTVYGLIWKYLKKCLVLIFR